MTRIASTSVIKVDSHRFIFASRFAADSTISKFHTPLPVLCTIIIIPLFTFLSPFSVAPQFQKFIFTYNFYLENCTRLHPYSLERVLARIASTKTTYSPLTKGIDENGRLTGIGKRERERERIHGHLTRRITFFAGIAGLSLRNLFELFTRIYTMPVCRGHNFEIRRQFLAVMSSTIHSRNPIFTLPCTNLT